MGVPIIWRNKKRVWRVGEMIAGVKMASNLDHYWLLQLRSNLAMNECYHCCQLAAWHGWQRINCLTTSKTWWAKYMAINGYKALLTIFRVINGSKWDSNVDRCLMKVNHLQPLSAMIVNHGPLDTYDDSWLCSLMTMTIIIKQPLKITTDHKDSTAATIIKHQSPSL